MTECQIRAEDGSTRCPCATDDILRLLADTRRREIITTLESCDDDRMSLPRLRSQSTTGHADPDSWHRAIHHIHLPMLDDHGLIDYDSEAEHIRYYHCEQVTTALEALEAH
ncbi:DUF7344 domain-containing protein [Natronorubrum sulfidifaciens]|uniref:DUF7344 domain-containing protein n=1 Tax=Natronorubrum sulfidifaciens JCM 14089 TaxID=1230460 RepID=L9W565_9EURY|nr:hypothetical protein [Natronorubrum sulfidifaciens]ELY44590.1 hypothetical protein C495_11834 [Natronorubrum sulfidifaciens JCM 14089]